MRSFGEGGKDPLSWNGRLVMQGEALSGGSRVAVETDV
jgi:hypothetical protein